MERCKNCKYYSDHSCSCDKFEIGYYDFNLDLPENKDSVRVEGDEGWGFEVGEEFGCVHFKQKQ